MQSRFANRFTVLLLAFLFYACTSDARVRDGDRLLAENKFDAALLAYQRGYLANPENPNAKIGLGRILTLRRISFHSGLDLLVDAYEQNPGPRLRRELILLRLDSGDAPAARTLLDPDHLSLQEYMTESASLERAAVSCFLNQNEESFYNLKSKSPDPQNDREAFMIRCLLSPGWRRSKLEDAKKLAEDIKVKQTRCELVARFPELALNPIEDCKKSFPGSIAIYRESIAGLQLSAGVSKQLFDDSMIVPGDPDPQPAEEPLTDAEKAELKKTNELPK